MGNIDGPRENRSNSLPCRLSFALPFLEGKGMFFAGKRESSLRGSSRWQCHFLGIEGCGDERIRYFRTFANEFPM